MRSTVFVLFLFSLVMVMAITSVSGFFFYNADKHAHIEALNGQVTGNTSPGLTSTLNFVYNFAVVNTIDTSSTKNIHESSIIIVIPTKTTTLINKSYSIVQNGLNITSSIKKLITPIYKVTPYLPISNKSRLVVANWTLNILPLKPTPYPIIRNLTKFL